MGFISLNPNAACLRTEKARGQSTLPPDFGALQLGNDGGDRLTSAAREASSSCGAKDLPFPGKITELERAESPNGGSSDPF